MLEINFSEEELGKLNVTLKNFYQALKEARPNDAPMLHEKFLGIFSNIRQNTKGFEYYDEGTGSDIKAALNSKKQGEQYRLMCRAINNMKMDIEGFYHGIFKERISD